MVDVEPARATWSSTPDGSDMRTLQGTYGGNLVAALGEGSNELRLAAAADGDRDVHRALRRATGGGPARRGRSILAR
jgi:hypothetical protein